MYRFLTDSVELISERVPFLAFSILVYQTGRRGWTVKRRDYIHTLY